VIGLTLATVVQLSMLGAVDGSTYAEAHQEAVDTGKPIVVMVGTTWCGPCQQMKKSVLPQIQQQGGFKDVAFALVDADSEKALARQITGGGPIPQLVMFRKTDDGWKRRKLVGLQNTGSVQEFINSGVALSKVARTAEVSQASHTESSNR